jgi:hypothetical protein
MFYVAYFFLCVKLLLVGHFEEDISHCGVKGRGVRFYVLTGVVVLSQVQFTLSCRVEVPLLDPPEVLFLIRNRWVHRLES